jgi:hypothetical protein
MQPVIGKDENQRALAFNELASTHQIPLGDHQLVTGMVTTPAALHVATIQPCVVYSAPVASNLAFSVMDIGYLFPRFVSESKLALASGSDGRILMHEEGTNIMALMTPSTGFARFFRFRSFK